MSTTTQPDAKTSIETLNKLLRGEISAVETYRQAVDNIDDSTHADVRHAVTQMQADHLKAVDELGRRVSALGGKPETDSGAWGSFAKLVTGTAKLFGDTAALKALKEGEEHGLKDYKDNVENVDANNRSYITGELIPNQQKHIATIDGLMAKA